MKEHKKAAEVGKWSHSGIVAHKEHCPLPVDWDNPTVLDTLNGKNKRALQYNLRLRESIHIQNEDTGPGRGLNEDWGGHLHTRAWLPALRKIDLGLWGSGGGLLALSIVSSFPLPPLLHLV